VPFPFQWVLAPCPEGILTVRETWETDGTKRDLIAITQTPCQPTEDNPAGDFRCFPSEVFVNCPALKASAAALLTHLAMPHEGPVGPAGPAGPIGPIGPLGPLGLPGLAGPVGQLPTLGTPDFSTLLQSIAGALGSLRRTPTTGRISIQPIRRTNGGFEAVPDPRRLEIVPPGGTVNVPVVPGSTADPTGTQAPRFPDTQRERILEILRLLAPQIANEIAQRRAQRRARALIREQLNALRAAIAAREASLRRIAMGFGQSGLGLGLQSDRRNGTSIQRAGIGGGILDLLISIGGNLTGDLLENLISRVTRDPERREITVPNGNGNGELEEALRQLGAGGDAATQCGLFRGSAGVRMSSRPASVVCLRDPVTGEARFFGHLGRPLVFQRDVTMAKNIPKLIRKLGGHTTSHARKR